MRWPVCHYLNASSTPAQIAGTVQRLHDQILQVLDGRVDGHNIAASAFDPRTFSVTAPTEAGKPKVFYIPALTPSDSGTEPYIRRKGAGTGTPDYGLEFLINTGSSTYSKVCVVDVLDPSKVQRLSFTIDAYTAAAPGAEIKAPTGKLAFEALAGQSIVVNESGADVDFRVESDGDANAIFVDAGNNRVGIFNGSPAVAYDVTGTARFSTLVQLAGGTSGHPALKRSGAYVLARLADDSADADFLAAGFTVNAASGGKLRLIGDSASTRTVTFPDATLTVAGANYANSWSGTQDFDGATLKIRRESSEPTPAVGEFAYDTTAFRLYFGES